MFSTFFTVALFPSIFIERNSARFDEYICLWLLSYPNELFSFPTLIVLERYFDVNPEVIISLSLFLYALIASVI